MKSRNLVGILSGLYLTFSPYLASAQESFSTRYRFDIPITQYQVIDISKAKNHPELPDFFKKKERDPIQRLEDRVDELRTFRSEYLTFKIGNRSKKRLEFRYILH